MSQVVTCPYCQAESVITVAEDSVETIRIQCAKCRGIFEYMPDFGSFSLPDQGAGFTPSRRMSGTTQSPEYIISDQEPRQSAGGAICCCVISLIILFYIIDFISRILFG